MCSVIPPESQAKCARFVDKVFLRIYNRWGKEVYSYESGGERTIYVDWDGRDADGRELSTGIYYYVADVTRQAAWNGVIAAAGLSGDKLTGAFAEPLHAGMAEPPPLLAHEQPVRRRTGRISRDHLVAPRVEAFAKRLEVREQGHQFSCA